jgi:hypothetical protein
MLPRRHTADLRGRAYDLGIGVRDMAFLIWPVIHRPVARVWARIVESEKPFCTLVFGGICTAVVLGHEFIKLLS